MRALLGLLLVGFLPSVVQAAPTLEIRARGELQIAAEPVDDDTARVRVTLSDDVGAPVPFARIEVQARSAGLVCGRPSACTTRRDGSCELRLRGCAADEIEARFEGTGTMDAVEFRSRIRSGGGTTIELRLEHGTTIDVDGPDVQLHVRRVGPRAPGAHLSIVDELGHPLDVRELDDAEETVVELGASTVGPPGVGSFVATTLEPDGTEASARLMVIRQRRTTLTLVRRSPTAPTLRASLRDRRGPLASALVTLLCDGARRADATTDAAGVVEFATPDDEETHTCHARFHPNAPGWTAARSANVRLVRAARFDVRTAVPWLSMLGALGVMAWLARRRQSADSPADPQANVPPAPVERSAPRQLLPSLTRVGVRLVSMEAEAPLAQGQVQIDADVAVDVDAEGRFEIDLAGRSSATLRFSAPGRAPESVEVRIPHRGEFSDVRVRLETTRMHARRAIELVARAVARDEDEAATITLREAERRLATSDDTAFPEHAEQHVYGRDEPELEVARDLVDRGHRRTEPTRRPPTAR